MPARSRRQPRDVAPAFELLAPAFELLAPDAPPAPVIVHVPHSSRNIPPTVRAGILLADVDLDEELRRMTDHHTDMLVRGVGALGATRFVNCWSRLAVDPERFEDPDREEMEAVGMGAVYVATSDRTPLRAPSSAVRDELLARQFRPYHAAFADLVTAQLREYDRCVIVDVHSYPRQALPYELHGDQPRPEVCIGTDPLHTPDDIRDRVLRIVAAQGMTSGIDTPFRGTFVPTRHLGDPRVCSVMLEIRRDTYLDEATAEPHAGLARVSRLCRDVVEAMLVPVNR
jgi:N-formylglutamate deformylase